MTHIDEKRFNELNEAGLMFKLIWIENGKEEYFFTGTSEQFADCYFSNVDYENVIDFAEENECIVLEYTPEEHVDFFS